ncbi:MAG: sigma-70 family RNA polymerase sigma factor [Bryobacteraceae bacterium]
MPSDITMPPGPVASNTLDCDKSLADAVRRKDRKATAEFVQRHADAIYSYILIRVRPNAADADDLSQDVFLAAWQCIGDYKGTSPLRAWLFGIARHKVEDYYRARLRVSDLDEAGAIAAIEAPLDSALDERRTRQRTVAALDRLREDYRLLLKWRYWDQKRTAEIASALGRTEKAVERMLARAREHFRREWEAHS